MVYVRASKMTLENNLILFCLFQFILLLKDLLCLPSVSLLILSIFPSQGCFLALIVLVALLYTCLVVLHLP